MKSKITQSTNFLNTFIGKFISKRIGNSVALFLTIWLTLAISASGWAQTVTSISPTSGPIAGGTPVIFSGTFGPQITYTAKFDGIIVSASRSNNNQLTASTPAHASGIVDVIVYANGNPISATVSYTYSGCTAPSISTANIGPVNSLSGTCDASVTLENNITVNSGTTPITYTYSLTNFGTTINNPYTFPVGTTTVYVKAENSCGSDIKSFTVTVVDNIDPVAITQPVTIYLNASGAASVTAAQVNNASTDNCEVVSWELDITDFTCADAGDNTVVLTVKDAAGNSNTAQATVTVVDNVAPVITCKSNSSRYVIPYETYYTITGSEFDATASDACGVASLTYKINGSASSANNASLNGVTLSVGTHTFVWTAVDVNGNKSECTTVVTVEKRPTTLTYTGDLEEQYSDQADLSATLIDTVSGDGVEGKTITFTIGSQSTTGVTNETGLATATLILTQSPIPTYNVLTTFAGDGSYVNSSNSDGFDITQENAVVNYIGTEITATQSTTNLTTNLDLRVSVRDIADDYRGDIKNATVEFILDGISIFGPINITQLVDPYTGVISLAKVVAMTKTSGSETFTFQVIVDGYYEGATETVITVYVPTGDFITGGGHIIPTTSVGTYPSDSGTKTNFGFNVKFNKKGTNLQGKLNFIWRSGGKVYQAKSNATLSLGVDINDPNAQIATFSSKCNLVDITDPLNPNSLGGNMIMNVNMTDRGEPGVNDDIAFTLWDGNKLLYSSNWNGTNTLKTLLNGGNILVHSGFNSETTNTTSTKTANNTSVKVAQPLEMDTDLLEFNVTAYPNPSADYFTLKLQGNLDEEMQKVEVNVFDLLGRQVYSKQGNTQDYYEFGQNFQVGVYLVTVKQGNNTASLKVIKK